MVGIYCGRIRIAKKKTLEGFAGFVVGMLLVMGVLQKGEMTLGMFWSVCLTAMEEVVCREVDNYVLPMLFMSLLYCLE